MKAKVLQKVFVVLCALPITAVLAGEPVHVRGYVRKDGTYVEPHYRSAPDSSFWNNWSTEGNINPYTGEEGKKDWPPTRGYSVPRVYTYPDLKLPPYGNYVLPSLRTVPDYPAAVTPKVGVPAPLAMEAIEERLRKQYATEMEAIGIQVDWQRYSSMQLLDMKLTAQYVREINRLTGEQLDWRQYNATQALDMKLTAQYIGELNKITGGRLDWHAYNATQALDMKLTAQYIREVNRRTGQNLDWRRFNATEALELKLSVK